MYCLNELADSARQAIAAGEPLAAGLRTGGGAPRWVLRVLAMSLYVPGLSRIQGSQD